MATKGKRAAAQPWTEEKQKAASAARNYIKLGDKRGQLLLSGAAKRWEAEPNFVYVPSLRVAGTPQDIERILGVDARQHIAQGYTAASVVGALRAQYEAELADLKANGRKGTKKAVAQDTGVSIARYAAMVDDATVEGGAARSPRSKSPRSKSASPKRKAGAKKARKSASPKRKSTGAKKARKSASPKRAGRKSASPKKGGRKAAGSPRGKRGARPLADKIAALTAGKVMDVSKLRVDGSGAKAIKMPGEKSRKVQVPGRMIVSDNKRGINAAGKLLGEEGLAAAWVGASGGKGGGSAATGRSRSRSRSASRGSREGSRSRSRSGSRSRSTSRAGSQGSRRGSSPARALPMSPAVSSPIGVPALPTVRTSPRGALALPSLPTVRAPTIGSPRGSPRL
jgi:hypothetical protein